MSPANVQRETHTCDVGTTKNESPPRDVRTLKKKLYALTITTIVLPSTINEHVNGRVYLIVVDDIFKRHPTSTDHRNRNKNGTFYV